MKNKYFIIFVIFTTVLLIILSYLRFPSFRYLIRDSIKKPQDPKIIEEDIVYNDISCEVANHTEEYTFQDHPISTKEYIHTILQGGVWRIHYPDFIPQFGGHLQNTGVYPGDGIAGIPIETQWDFDDIGIFHKGSLVYKIRRSGLISSAPAVYNGIIYFGTTDGHFYAVDLESGQEKWVVRIGRASERKRGMHFRTDSCPPAPAIFSSPVIYNGVAYFGTTYGYVFALNINNGDIIWRAEIPGLHLANPKIYKDYLYIGSKNRHFYKLDAKTGDLIWRHKTQGEIITTPAIYEDKIFINCQEGYLYAIDTGGNLRWKIDMGVPTRNSPVISEGILFLDTDYFHAIDTSYGSEIWRAGPYRNISQCAVSKGRVYFYGTFDDHNTGYSYAYIYSYNAENGTEEWKHKWDSWKSNVEVPAGYKMERLDPEIPSNQIIISGDIIHLLGIANNWYRIGKGPYRRGTGRVYGISENRDKHYPQDYRLSNIYSYRVNELQSPVAIYNEVMYYGAEISDTDGCYTALYAIQSMQEKFRWQPSPHDMSISYPLLSENLIVLYDIVVKDGDNIQKDTTEFQIATYDIHSKEKIYSGKFPIEGNVPLRIFNKSSALHTNKLFVEIGVLSRDKKRVVSNAYYAFDIIEGKFIWKYNLGEKILNSPPLIYEDKIYIGSCYIIGARHNIPINLKTSDKIFHALNAKNGEEIWNIGIIGNLLSKPLIYNDILYFGTDEGYVYAIDRFEGKKLWKFHINGGISSTPVVHDDIVFIGSWNRNIYAIDSKTGRGIWKFRARGEVRGDILVHDGHIYFVSIMPDREARFIGHEITSYLQSVNIITGIENWKIVLHFTHGFISSNICNFLINSEVIYILINNKGYSNYSLQAIDYKTGAVIWDKQIEVFDYNALKYPAIIIRNDKLNIVWRKKTQPLEAYISTFDAKTGEIIEGYNLADLNIHF